MQRTFTYEEYLSFFEDLVKNETTTGENPSPSLVNYTKLNWSRTKRGNKTFKSLEKSEKVFSNMNGNYKLKVITEPWCGDAAQIVPVVAGMVKDKPNFEMEIYLRDEHEDLMNQHLTNGGKSIPIFILEDKDTGKELLSWGPRPNKAQNMVMAYKAMDQNKRPSYDEFVQTVQQWYNHDKGKSIQHEISSQLEKML